MPSLVEFKHNPYIPNLSILIDGKQPPDFSRLVQYLDEDIWLWYGDILDAIYSEIRRDFVLSFTGTAEDALIMELVCKQHTFCLGFKAIEFIISESLQERMKKLNQFIKNTEGVEYAKTIIDAVFMISSNLQEYLEDISNLDVNNLFCAVRVSIIGARLDYEETEHSFLFVLTDSLESEVERIENLNLRKPVFVLVLGKNESLKKVTNFAWYFETTTERLFHTIFSCLLQIPLLVAFRRCIQSLQKKFSSSELYKISAIEPIVKVHIADRIESGKSRKIDVELDPPVGAIPDLVFKTSNQNIASCDGICVFGKQEGVTSLEVYHKGDKKPFFKKDIRIYKRNRITKLILSDDMLILGEGDKKRVHCDYFPQNADNVQSITWKSSDETIAKVDSRGAVAAVGRGNCRLICTAEHVSAQCMCTVKPYLQEIFFDFELENDVLILEPMDEFVLRIKTYPDNCIDNDLFITSSDYSIVNVVKNTLYAKIKGEAIITIQNSNGRISRNFKVMISKKKVGFFAKIFK